MTCILQEFLFSSRKKFIKCCCEWTCAWGIGAIGIVKSKKRLSAMVLEAWKINVTRMLGSVKLPAEVLPGGCAMPSSNVSRNYKDDKIEK